MKIIFDNIVFIMRIECKTGNVELVAFNTTILNTTTFNTGHLVPTTINPHDI